MSPIVRKPKSAVADLLWLDTAPTSFPEFLPEAERLVGSPPSRVPLMLGYVLCGILVLTLLWACLWRFSLFAIAPGETKATSGVQIVQPRSSGQVTAIRVANGDRVSRGDILVELDPTDAKANLAIIDDNLQDLRAEAARLHAEIRAASTDPIDETVRVTWPAESPAGAQDRQEKLLRARLTQLKAVVSGLTASLAAKKVAKANVEVSITSQQSLIAARSERTSMHEQLADKGWDSRSRVLEALEVLRQEQVSLATLQGSLGEAQADIEVVSSAIAKTLKSFLAEDYAAVATTERQIDELEQQRRKTELDLANLVIRAPASGVVEGLAVTSVAQSLRAGEQLLQIVSDQVPVVLEAYVLNTDIGFVRKGQRAVIKVDSFPFTRYGTISGHVTEVAADAITGRSALQEQKNDAVPERSGPLSVTNPSQQTSDLVFPVNIALDQTFMEVNGTKVSLTPGMSVVAEIETERQRAIQYFIHPLTRAFQGEQH